MLTLFRLALNVSSSRLILLNGHTGAAAAGDVIQAFGNFVVGGNYVIGAVIFLVLIAIQYVVINHGAVRISEVTARFTLDSLPGKQMSIDSDLNAGLIDESEARRRRKQLAGEAEFFGAMDGASRFTQRDAVAGLLITGINIVAGLLIGVLQHGVDIMKALQTYTVLTIGDGLVTVIPALMISVAGAMIITRASSDNRIGVEFQKQLFGAAPPLLLASAVLVALAAFPGLPKIPFLLLGGGLGTVAWRMKTRDEKGSQPAARDSRSQTGERESRRSAARRAALDRSRREPHLFHSRRREFAAAQAHRGNSQTTCHRTGIHHSRDSRDRQPQPARSRIFHQPQGNRSSSLRTSPGQRTRDRRDIHRAPTRRPPDQRSGVRCAGVVDTRRRRPRRSARWVTR